MNWLYRLFFREDDMDRFIRFQMRKARIKAYRDKYGITL